MIYFNTLLRNIMSFKPGSHTCPKNRKNQGIVTISGNTASQTFQTVGDFYDVIGRIGSISTLKVHPRRSPTSAIFTISVNMKFVCLGHRGCLSLSFLATKA